MIRAHALLPHPFDTSPSQRFRLEQWQRPLSEIGVELELSYLLKSRRHSVGLWASPPSMRALSALMVETAHRTLNVLTEKPDVWIVHREASLVGPPLIERLARARAPLVFDLDDAVWLPSPDENTAPTIKSRIRSPGKVNDILRMASGVSAGNQYLADYSSQFNKRVHIVPTTIDTLGTYRASKSHTTQRSGAATTVGWSGSHSTAPYICGLLPTLAAITEIDIKLLVIGAEVSHPGLRIECRPWRADTEVQDLLDMDVGLMPLKDDASSRGKCGLKALQYMALGIPAIVSPVGVNTEIVKDGINGYLATDAESWERALRLVLDADHRAHLGRNARETVARNYSAEIGARKIAALLQDVLRS